MRKYQNNPHTIPIKAPRIIPVGVVQKFALFMEQSTTNSTKMTQCKCYADYEGEQCEIEKIFAKFVRYVTFSSLAIALTCLGMTALLIVGNDVWSSLIKKTIKMEQSKAIRFKYYTSKETTTNPRIN